jgi:thiamine-phosphate pyrophosphorylase
LARQYDQKLDMSIAKRSQSEHREVERDLRTMTDFPTLRILDAELNRAGEGLRVVEDYLRFVLDDRFLTANAKDLRHELAAAHSLHSSTHRHAARDTMRDVGASISHDSEEWRADAWDVCAASLKRTEQALRSLEEYGKLLDATFARRMEGLRYRLYTMEKAIDVGRSSRDRLEGVRLCVLVDGRDSASEFEQLIRELVEAGVGMIQLRDKRLQDRELAARARLLVSRTRPQPPAPTNARASGQPPALPGIGGRLRDADEPPAAPAAVRPRRTLAVINDRPDIAAAVHADGVHLGQEDLTVKDARAIVGPRMLIGVSTHNIQQARAAVLDGANYLGAGPTFPSQTKTFDAFAGLDYLREVAAEIRLPTFAIGGINARNLPDVVATGVTRVAVSSAITAGAESRSAARDLLDILEQAVPSADSAYPPQPSAPSR